MTGDVHFDPLRGIIFGELELVCETRLGEDSSIRRGDEEISWKG